MGNTNQLESRVYVEPCKGYDSPYLFISYARVDTQKVEAILNVLYRRGFRIWYDQGGAGIQGGEDWHRTIEKRVRKSASFLAFISRATEYREVVLEEILWGIRKSREDPSYKVVFVFLERVSPEGFPDQIRDEMRKKQFIDFSRRGGLTERFVRVLCGVSWPAGMIDQEYRQAQGWDLWTPDESDEEEIRDSIFSFTDTNGRELRAHIEAVMPKDLPGGIDLPDTVKPYYPISPEEMDAHTVYPIVMDNQWLPADMYSREDFCREGLRGESVVRDIVSRQSREIKRALLHNWQILVNRASILNSRVFSEYYHEDSPEYEAFGRLVEDAAIVIFLYKEEKNPMDLPDEFKISPEDRNAWIRFCLGHEVTCLRFDWQNEKSNNYENDTYLAYRFRDFCLTAADNKYLMRRLADLFGIPEEAVTECWRRVQTDVLAYRDDPKANPKGRIYNRERFYQSFLIDPEKHSPDEGILDLVKHPLAREMKQVIDLRYDLNLPFALGLQPLIPMDSRLSPDLFMESGTARSGREIEADELCFAVSEFRGLFRAESMPAVSGEADLSLQDILRLRGTREWRDYLNIMTEGKKRSHLDQVDFFDTLKVFSRYEAFLQKAREILPGLCWKDEKAALSILYRFEDVILITVYEKDRRRFREEVPLETALSRLDRKARLDIDYVCGDYLRKEWDSVLVTELRLFEGVTHGSAGDLYKDLLKELEKLGFEKAD